MGRKQIGDSQFEAQKPALSGSLGDSAPKVRGKNSLGTRYLTNCQSVLWP